MSIIRKTVFNRPNTSVPFQTTHNDSARSYYNTILQPAMDQGKLTIEFNEIDDLNKEKTYICADIETLALTFNSVTVEQQAEYFNTRPPEITAVQTITGIDQPFTVTSVYTFPDGTPVTTPLDLSDDQLPSTYFGDTRDLQICIELNDSKVVNLSTTTNTVTVVHQYDDDNDFNANAWKDGYLLNALSNIGVTKNVQFQLV